MGKTIQVGDVAPDFTRLTADGHELRLSDFRGKRSVVLFFYPKDHTSVCTAQACAFRDREDEFRGAAAEIIGVSGDSAASHQRFAANHSLSFHLLSDSDGSLRALFGVPKSLWVIPGRVTYVIDRQGIVRFVCSALLNAEKHSAEALRVVLQLEAADSEVKS
jgi:peroxiredoxin Q/BCP